MADPVSEDMDMIGKDAAEYCRRLTLLNEFLTGSPPISGHDFINVNVDEHGKGTLRCRRCNHESTAW
jgi:hypothetical protein